MIKASQTCIKHIKSAFFCCTLYHIIWERTFLSVSLYLYNKWIGLLSWQCSALDDFVIRIRFQIPLKGLDTQSQWSGNVSLSLSTGQLSFCSLFCTIGTSRILMLAFWLIEHVKSVSILHNFSWAFQYVNIIITTWPSGMKKATNMIHIQNRSFVYVLYLPFLND